jgi:hypothetical protein
VSRDSKERALLLIFLKLRCRDWKLGVGIRGKWGGIDTWGVRGIRGLGRYRDLFLSSLGICNLGHSCFLVLRS